HIKRLFPGGRDYVFTFAAIFVFLLVIYSNSFQGAWVFDDTPNIVENNNIRLESLDREGIVGTFYGITGEKISRPLAYFSFALNYYFGEFDVFGYHLVNFVIHYLAAVFLFLFINTMLRLPILRDRYGPASYGIALLAAVFWATSPLQVTAVTYIVQRMASMAGLFYIMALYFYLKGRIADDGGRRALFWSLCGVSALLAAGTKENAVLLPFSIWLFDLLLIQGATRKNVIRNLKVFVPVALVVGAVGLWYVDIGAIISGEAYTNRPFTTMERLLTQPRIVVWYVSLLLYPLASRLTLIHDIELSTSLFHPWTTLPAIGLVAGLLVLGVCLARRFPLLSFAVLFYFLNHVVESTFLSLELIYEHRNYIPSLFFFVPVAIAMVRVMDYFSYRKAIQFTAAAVFTFLLFAQGHVVYERNTLFAHPVVFWTDNVIKSPELSRTHNNLGNAYWKLGRYEEARGFFEVAIALDNESNRLNIGAFLHNYGSYFMHVEKDYDRALELFRSAGEIYPGYVPVYYDTARCYLWKGDVGKAEQILGEKLSRWPDDARLRHAYSLVLLEKGQYDRAVEEARRALSIKEDDPGALAVLGEAFRRTGKDRLAALYWERYVEQHPEIVEGYLALIELYAKLDRPVARARTVGRLMVLKGERTWNNLFDDYEKAAHGTYDLDREKLLSAVAVCFGRELAIEEQDQ
ncbi:MAG TPA: tetratricopeptide repeat protein, partial [Deltaproteobacteria bacterium]|nr:tetratricopeptide repeat protein [Deltaproteobacteria bacterium]